MRMESPLNQRLRWLPPDVVYTPIDVTSTGFVLLLPLLAMQFTDEVAWTLLDFVTAGTLVFGAGLVLVLTARTMPKYRAITGIAVMVALIYVWAELAVGIFTTWGS